MQNDQDRYEIYYADKLWQLLPAIYRAQDSDTFGQNGPLRELVDRIGAEAAIVRRSIDRMWEDQSIETSDDWVIAYIGDLLATNLVGGLDARGQRLDVAKTIYYRRRKGTLAILEEIATNITGWDARVVEFFRRMGRTRHNFDPEIGLPSATDAPDDVRKLQLAERLVGAWTGTTIGGWADLRNVYGASRAHTAFDEYFSTADFRRGQGQVGWYNIPHLGVFLWRLRSYGVVLATPVPITGCPGQYTFDPTGREIPLFAAAARGYGDTWVSPEEWQLPTAISAPLLQAERPQLYPGSLGVYRLAGNFTDLVDPATITVTPERGRFRVLNPAGNDQFLVSYHYGFSSEIGAGPYDRRILKEQLPPQPQPLTTALGGGNVLQTPLGALAPTGTLTIADSQTYTKVKNVGNGKTAIQQVTLRADNQQRPLIRPPTNSKWTFTGAPGAQLALDGLFVSGGDIVLSGTFDTVTLICCTLDPGAAGAKAGSYAQSVDGIALAPCHLYVKAEVRRLEIHRCILGPIQTQGNGAIETLMVADSIVQGLWSDKAFMLTDGTVSLSRCTVLGQGAVHRLEASECIFDDVMAVDDPQHGCVRFSAWATGSVLPRQYESVEVAPQGPLFTSRIFGRPGYAQLLAGVDSAIRSGAPGATIAEGAQDGAEMGAFAGEKNPIKERALRIKYQEYMPLGLVPVIVYVD